MFRTIFFGRGTVLEELYLTADMVIVARIGGGSLLIWPLATWFRAGKKEEKRKNRGLREDTGISFPR